MPEIPPTSIDFGDASLALLERVDVACDRFESAWSTGDRPRIESYLDLAPVPDRDELLRRLLALELGLRRREGERPGPDSYRARFPDRTGPIAEAFDETTAQPDGTRAGPATLLGGSGLDSEGLESPPPTLGPAGAPADEADRDTLPVGAILGEYELLEPIGRGGMGIVYRAWQRGAERVVALKLIRPRWLARLPAEHARAAIELFLAEARTAAGLHHDHIVTVHDVGLADGRPYYSMRWIAGRSLAQVLRAGPLPDARAVALLEPIARAVQHAHDRGVLHRDLKPANILLDADDTPYVADFGLAKLLADPDAPGPTPDRAGTPSYMPPEQARGRVAVGRAGDVYGLGATLYDLLTGRPPFRAASDRQTLRQVIRDEPVPPRQLNPAIGRDLEAICLKCLEKDPHHRYPSAGRLAADLRRWQAGVPTEARPVGLAGRAGRWARRHPTRVATAAAVATVVLGLSATVGQLSTDLRNVAVLVEDPPEDASRADRDALESRRGEAARALIRSGRADLARALFRRASTPGRPEPVPDLRRALHQTRGDGRDLRR